jgi:hypothetical protein
VLRYHLQEGPTAVEVHKSRQILNALKSLCLVEGIAPEKVQKIISKSDGKYSEGVMRVISRLLCNGSADLKIIPGCFDRWRQWIKYRKTMGYWLQYCNNFVSPRRYALSNAFKTWRSQNSEEKATL